MKEKEVVSRNKKIIADFPDLVQQWHPTKNGTLAPDEVPAGYSKKVWWKCPKGPDHEWEATAKSRANGRGCPFCAGQRVSVTNSLATLYPDLAKEWHPTENGSKTPHQVYGGGKEKYWWKCPKGPDHEWEASIQKRGASGRGCPFCSGHQVSVTNSLATLNPEIASQLHPTKNKGLTADEITAGSKKTVWWKCPKGPDHEWQAKVNTRTSGSGCPCCAGYQVSVTNSLLTLHSKIASELHLTKNKGLTPDKITAGTRKRVWWKCPKGSDHVWQTTVNTRTSKKGKKGCPFCAGQRVSVTNSLLTIFPKIASELHPEKNKGLTPDKIVAGTSRRVWWKCPRGPDHVWQTTVVNRTKGGRNCPYCAGRKVSITNSLFSLHPEIASELHPTKNGDLTSDKILAGTSKKVWWKCSNNPDHEWPAKVVSRTHCGSGCPLCNLGWTVDAVRSFIKSLIEHIESFIPTQLYTIFQQAGALESRGIAKSLIKEVSAGRFPLEELKKFAEGEGSAVDRFVSGEISFLENTSGSSDSDDLTLTTIPIDPERTEDSYSLPIVKTNEVLGAIDAATRIVSMDQEAIDFLIASGTAELWKDAFQNVDRAREQAISFEGGEYAMRVRDRFLAELREAQSLTLPEGYAFRFGGKLTPPNLMQRLIASQLKSKCNLGNWSGTGAGKTLSAVLASRVIDARLTIICCPNAVVGGQTDRGWADEICDIFPGSSVQTKTFIPVWSKQSSHRYLVLNYELFQQPDSPGLIKQLLAGEQIDMIVIDEVHYSKQRNTINMSRRRELITALISAAREQNPLLRVLGLSATPVINNLQEGKSLLEMVTGVQYPELQTRATVANCMKLHQQMVVHGFRWKPDYHIGFKEKRINIDCSEYIEDIRALGAGKGSPLTLEQILTEARLPSIREQCLPGKKTLIYTHYVSGITERIASALREDGHRVGLYTGDDKKGLKSFLDGNLDVLIGSSAIGTGVDGLQHVCDRMIINVLPWTSAEYEQLKGRILRQGQQSDSVTIILPITYADVDGERWSWDESKLNRLYWKKSVADAAVDGVVPEGHLRTQEQAYRDLMDWLERLATGTVDMLERPLLTIPLPEDDPKSVKKRLARYGDFSKMNQRWNHSLSNKTHDRLKENSEEWYQYHTLYRNARELWSIVPYEEMINWCRERIGFNYEIGDFGCGEAKLAEAVSDIHTVHSFDHIAVNSNITSCDIASVPLDDETLDVALFSLSLMGKNFADYLKEAHRTLRLDGHLIIFEPTSRFIDDAGVNHAPSFAKDLEQFGFTLGTVEVVDRFTRIHAIKRSRLIAINKPSISFRRRSADEIPSL